jgi:two-component system chemotaxis response regulator CheV
MELLLFTLQTKQLYGINVFKVREIINSLPLTLIPMRHKIIRGISHIRGITIPIIDLNMAIGNSPLPNPEERLIIVSEYNKTIQGFMVETVVKIVNISWTEVHPPPVGSGKTSYLTAVTDIEGDLVEIIDVEKILQEIIPTKAEVAVEHKEIATKHIENTAKQQIPQITKVLVCDDSIVARKQITQSLKQLNIELIVKNNGKEALDYLKECTKDGSNITQKLLLVISDVEMPEMDGYTLTAMIREDPHLKDLHVVLHTSLSGIFNNALISKVGANQFIAKFDPNALAKTVTDRMQALNVDKVK